VRNEATAILDQTGAGQTILTSAGASGSDALRIALSPSGIGARHGIAAYSRVAQAGMLDRWISNMVQP
jgi:hypothetical protein